MPYPAIVIDRHGEIISANAGQRILADGCAEHLHANAYRLALHPDGMAPRIANFATAVDVTISELELEAFLPADEATAATLTQVAERP